MDEAKLKQFRDQLVLVARRLRGAAEALADDARSGSEGDNAGDLSHYPLHLADRGTDEFLVDIRAVSLKNETQLLKETLAAIERIEAGTFGTCESCGEGINPERLEALPAARLCIACAQQTEAPPSDFDDGRPRQPADTLAPEGTRHAPGENFESHPAEY